MSIVKLRSSVATPAIVRKVDFGTNVKNVRLAEKLSDRWCWELDQIRSRRRYLSDADLLVDLEEQEITCLAKLEGCDE